MHDYSPPERTSRASTLDVPPFVIVPRVAAPCLRRQRRAKAPTTSRPARAACKDRQLHGVTLDRVVEKRRLEQALNAKEFAVLAGICYSTAREWFRLPGFPVFRGVVFWQDFTDWRRARAHVSEGTVESTPAVPARGSSFSARDLPARAARILQEE
jgi:hypothetical protein